MIRVALLGAGIGAAHLEGYCTLSNVLSVDLLADQDTARAEALRDSDSYAVVPDIETALANPDIDLIDICLPPHLHAPVALRALRAGKHVICEKPLATSMADIAHLRQAQEASGRQVFPVFQYRWGPAFAQLRALIDADLTGRPHVAAAETHWSRGAEYYAVPWRGTWAGEEGGAVLGHAIHIHDLLTHFMGPVAGVSAMTATRINPIETEDCAAINLHMANGALCTSSVTLGAATDETRLRLVFDRLTATSASVPYAPGTGAWRFTARDPADQPRVDATRAAAPKVPEGFAGFLSAVARALTTGDPTAPGLEDGAASIELVTAIYHAARSGTQITLPLASTHPLYRGWGPAG